MEFTSKRATGEDGYLISKGLIPLPSAEQAKYIKEGKMINE